MNMIRLKPNTRIELHGTPAFGGFPGVAPEQAVIARWTAVSGPRDKMPGWHIVKFSDGARLCVHESRFRVIDNQAPALGDMLAGMGIAPPKTDAENLHIQRGIERAAAEGRCR